MAPGVASAYGIGPTTPGKWGGPVFGTGADVTYSFMSGGQACEVPTTCASLSGFMPTGFEAEIEKAFDAWATVANLTFSEVVDDGSDFNDSTSSGDIRFAGHFFDGNLGVLAHGYFPPVNGLSAAGDVHFDSDEVWKIGLGGPGFDVFTVAVHEIGHALGLAHEGTEDSIMNPFYSEEFIELQADDIAAIQLIYGPALVVVPVPAAVWLFASGILGLVGIRKKNALSQLSV